MVMKINTSAIVDKDGMATGFEVININSDATTPQTGDPLLIMGFGYTEGYAYKLAETMQEITLLTYDEEICAQIWNQSLSSPEILADTMLCIGQGPSTFGGT